jgi:hypothetical protein
MRRFLKTVSLLLSLSVLVHAAESPPLSPPGEEEANSAKDSETSEEMDIIPKSAGVTVSTEAITPISEFPERNAYDQGLAEYEQAVALSKGGDHEAASDLALQAYYDLCLVRIRRPKKKRAKLHAQRYQAALIYLQASVAYIKDFVKEEGKTRTAIEEGKARLGDLKDVAHDYPDLLRWWNHLIDSYPGSLGLKET